MHHEVRGGTRSVKIGLTPKISVLNQIGMGSTNYLAEGWREDNARTMMEVESISETFLCPVNC